MLILQCDMEFMCFFSLLETDERAEGGNSVSECTSEMLPCMLMLYHHSLKTDLNLL